jgi:hypothetical protein
VSCRLNFGLNIIEMVYMTLLFIALDCMSFARGGSIDGPLACDAHFFFLVDSTLRNASCIGYIHVTMYYTSQLQQLNLRKLHVCEGSHLLLPLLLSGEELAFASDVTTVALGGDVFS